MAPYDSHPKMAVLAEPVVKQHPDGIRTGWRHPAKLAALSCSLLFAGCATVGPDYTAPAMALKPFHGSHDLPIHNPAGDVKARSTDAWWTSFDDADLNRFVEQAQQQNLDLAGALARVQQARAVARIARAKLLPSGTAAAQTSTMHQSLRSPTGMLASPNPGYNRNETLFDEGISASWEPDVFGGLRRADESAVDQAIAMQAASAAVRISITADVADAYFQIRGDQLRLSLAQQQIDVDIHLLQLIEHRLEVGASSDRELAQTQALVEQARATLPALKIDLDAQSNRLDVLTGNQPGTSIHGLGNALDHIPAPPSIPADLTPAEMLRRRPDIVAAERRLAASNANIGVAISDYYPKISLSGLLGFESLGAKSLISAASFQPDALMGFRWRLFDFGAVDAEVAQARGANAEALAAYKESVLRAASDIENGFTSVTQNAVQSDAIDKEIDALTRANRTTREAYEAGAISLTDVLDTERQLLAAQDEGARSHTDGLRAAVFSFRAMGGGWQTIEPAPSHPGKQVTSQSEEK